MKTIRCVVACFDASGKPDFFCCTVECTEQEYEIGEHYTCAKQFTEEQGYGKPMVVFDENDGPEWLFTKLWSMGEEVLVADPDQN